MCWKRHTYTRPTPATPAYLYDVGYNGTTEAPEVPCSRVGDVPCPADFCYMNGDCCNHTLANKDVLTCHCWTGFKGMRCDQKQGGDSFLEGLEVVEGQRRAANITITVTLVFGLLITCAIVVCCVMVLVKRKRRRASNPAVPNPEGGDTEMALLKPPVPVGVDQQSRDPVDDIIANAHQVEGPLTNGHPGSSGVGPGLSWRQATGDRERSSRMSTSQSHSIPSDLDKVDVNSNGRDLTNGSGASNGLLRTEGLSNDSRDEIGGKG